MNIPRAEHPNPQWKRENWRSLNGEWEFAFDFGRSARDRELYKKGSLPQKIIVPFCPESELSGIGYTDFIPSVCYRKTIALSDEDLKGNVFLHFGAVDYHSYIYVNGSLAGEHIGGYSSFKLDITPFVGAGENVLFVIAEDEVRDTSQPTGKQCGKYESYGCYYTRTTGIWQTVWIELVPKSYVKACKYYTDITNQTLTVTGVTEGDGELALQTFYDDKPTGSARVIVKNGFFSAHINLTELHLWEIGCGRLYKLLIKFGADTVKSYFGMREVCISNNRFMLNNKPLFLRMVLDQGFYPDGIYTASSDEALKRDIDISKELGFDGARLHEKVFEKRFIYHCDKEGYIVWGEHANWGMENRDSAAQGNFICEWTEIIERDFNSPSVIGWCPFNETWNYIEKNTKSRLLESVYKVTKLYDKTRPCIDTSGNYHIDKREIYDVHDYEQDIERFAENYAHIDEGVVNDAIQRRDGNVQPYYGEPIFVSEYGGIRCPSDKTDGWGYGNAPRTKEEFIERLCSLTNILISNPRIIGLCYTQLYDVEQEQNGLYYYDRTKKLDDGEAERFKAVLTQKAEIEK